VQAGVLVVVVPMINLDADWGSLDASALVWVGLALIAAAVVGLVIAALVPSLRARLAPPAHAALTNVRGLPGGIGVAEAGLTAGLVAVGIPRRDGAGGRAHPPPADLLPASGLGLLGAALVGPARLRMTTADIHTGG